MKTDRQTDRQRTQTFRQSDIPVHQVLSLLAASCSPQRSRTHTQNEMYKSPGLTREITGVNTNLFFRL